MAGVVLKMEHDGSSNVFLPGVLKRVPGFWQHMVAWRNDLTSIIPLGDFDGTFREVKPWASDGPRFSFRQGLGSLAVDQPMGGSPLWGERGGDQLHLPIKKRISQPYLMTRGCWPQPWPFSTRKKTTPKVPPARRFLHSKKKCRPVASQVPPARNPGRTSAGCLCGGGGPLRGGPHPWTGALAARPPSRIMGSPWSNGFGT